MRWLSISLLWISLCCQALDYQTSDASFYQYKGLSKLDNNNHAGLVDRNGYTWIATRDGVFRYDGIQTLRILPQAEQAAMRINSMVEADNNLWLATSSGLFRIDTDNFNIRQYAEFSATNEISHLATDFNGQLWLSGNSGIHFHQAKLDQFKNFQLPKRYQQSAQIHQLSLDGNGILWIASRRYGLLQLNPKTGKYREAQHWLNKQLPANFSDQLLGANVNDLIYTQQNSMIVASQQAMIEISNTGQVSGIYSLPQASANTWTSPTRMAEDKQANIWVASNGQGLYKLDADRQSLLLHQTTSAASNGLSGQSINDLFISKDGVLGLVFKNYAPMFLSTQVDAVIKREIYSINGDNFNIREVRPSANGQQWLIGETGWLRLSSEGQQYYPAPSHTRNGPLNLVTDSKQQTWFGTSDGLFKWDLETASLKQQLDLDVKTLNHHWESGIWLTTDTAVYQINDRAGMAKYRLPGLNSDLPGSSTTIAYANAEFGFWLAGDGFVSHFSKDKLEFETTALSNSTFNAATSKILIRNGTFFMTGNGLLQADIVNDANGTKLINVKKISALADLEIDSISADSYNNLWLKHQSGLKISRYNLSTQNLIHFNVQDSLSTPKLRSNLLMNAKGTLSFANHNLLMSVQDANRQIPRILQLLKITSGEAFNRGEPSQQILNTNVAVELAHQHTGLRLHFSDGSQRTGAELKVQYRIVGAIDSWVDVASNDISLSKLPQGHYQFQLRQLDQPHNFQSIDINVAPAPWQSLEYRLAAASALILILSLAAYFLRRRSMKKNQLATDKKMFADGFEQLVDGYCICDSHGYASQFNQAFSDIVSIDNNQKGINLTQFKSLKESNTRYRQAWLALNQEGQWKGVLWIKDQHGKDVPVECRASRIDNIGLHWTQFLLTITDLSQQYQNEQQLHQLAYFDCLTDTANRHALNQRLQQMIKVQQGGKPSNFALLYVDIDGFNSVNSSLGHTLGDKLLSQFVDRLKRNLDTDYFLARVGGDEFVILLEGYQDNVQLQLSYQAIMGTTLAAFNLEQHQVKIELSMGVSLFPDHGKDAATLLNYANIAMTQAKTRTGNSIRLFEPLMAQNSSANEKLFHGIKEAIKFRAFVPFYQAKINMQTGELVGAEALIRWRKAGGEILSPDNFLDCAENNGLTGKLGLLILERVCQQLSVWKVQGNANTPVSINLSHGQLLPNDFIAQLTGVMEKYDIPSKLIEFDVDEATLLENKANTRHKVKQLRDLGHKIYMDKFGLGRSQLSQLAELPIDGIKLDRSLISRISHDSKKQAIVKSIIQLAETLNLESIAMGVEDQLTSDCIATLGASYGQGFYYGRALPPTQFEASQIFTPETSSKRKKPADKRSNNVEKMTILPSA